jgi:argininosuccinate lyase
LAAALLATLKGPPTGYNRDLREDEAAYLEAVDVVRDGLALIGIRFGVACGP